MTILRSLCDILAVVLMFPCALCCWLEHWINPEHEGVFVFFGQLIGLVPGLPGTYLRRAFYFQTLSSCARDIYIGFGSHFTHREACVESRVYIGSYALIGCAVLRKECMIGSRASLLSGGSLHAMDESGNWLPADRSQLQKIVIGENAWLGEGAIVMCDIGARAMVAAGAVVSTPVPERVMVGGNPARFIRSLVRQTARQQDSRSDTSHSEISPQLQEELEV
jgi:acetyltransferase-like isoleucine patch superfamily enzyme